MKYPEQKNPLEIETNEWLLGVREEKWRVTARGTWFPLG